MDYQLSYTLHLVIAMVLLIAGIASIVKMKTGKCTLFASIPIIFGLNQLFEGLLIVAIQGLGYEHIESMLAYSYLLLTEAILPVWITLSILLIERHLFHKIALRILLGLSLFVSLYLALCLLTFSVSVDEIGGKLHFIQPWTPERVVTSIPYVLITLLPYFLSGFSAVRWMGLVFFCGCALI
jgi:hypothetical protein